jgi:hypothetical protein
LGFQNRYPGDVTTTVGQRVEHVVPVLVSGRTFDLLPTSPVAHHRDDLVALAVVARVADGPVVDGEPAVAGRDDGATRADDGAPDQRCTGTGLAPTISFVRPRHLFFG